MARTISSTYSTGITLTNTADNPISVTGTITASTGTALYGQGGATNSWTITNSGLISGTASGGDGVALGSGASQVTQGIVTNQSTGVINGNAFGVSINPTGSVSNAGAITGGNVGVYLGTAAYSAAAGTVTNLGGGTISSPITGVEISGSGAVTNQSGGTISGASGDGVEIRGQGISGQQPGVNVSNAGMLSGATGVLEFRGGSVTNLAGGTITGTTNQGIYLLGAGIVTNAGLVSGHTFGVSAYEGGAITNAAGGTIEGTTGVNFGAANQAGLQGTFDNAGTVIGTSGYAVDFAGTGGTYRLIARPGAVFTGKIFGGNTGALELGTGSGVGTLSGFGSTITNFSTVQFDPGARWGISGDATGFGAIGTIAGFASGDRIDITDFDANGATFANNALTLTSTVASPLTLNVAGSFTSSDFQIVPDGAGGTDVSLPFNWTDTTGNWNNASNWNVGAVPATPDSALIAPTGTNTITVNDHESAANVILNGANDTLAIVVGGFLGATGSITIDAGTLADTGGFTATQVIDNGVMSVITASSQPLDATPVSLGGTLQVASAFIGVPGTLALGTKEVVTQSGASALITSAGDSGNAIVNQGTIDAGFTGGTMTISPANFINQGTITVSNGETLAVTAPITSGTSAGTIDVGGKGIADFTSSVDAQQSLTFTDAAGTLRLHQPGSVAASILNFVPGDTIDLPGIAANKADWSANQLTISNSGTTIATLSLPGSYASDTFTVASDGSGGSAVTVSATCYAAGTRILTPRGEVPIERLHRHDLVLTVSGQAQPIRWIGRRRVDFRSHPNRQRVLPVRIAAHAFGPGRPKRNLLLSPDHAVFVEGVLIPIRHLVNGSNVTQVERQTITYYHIELPRHDVLLADGMPAESYLEAGARSAFGNGEDVIQLYPEFTPPQDYYAMLWEQYGYAPLVVSGETLERVRATLSATRYAA